MFAVYLRSSLMKKKKKIKIKKKNLTEKAAQSFLKQACSKFT